MRIFPGIPGDITRLQGSPTSKMSLNLVGETQWQIRNSGFSMDVDVLGGIHKWKYFFPMWEKIRENTRKTTERDVKDDSDDEEYGGE